MALQTSSHRNIPAVRSIVTGTFPAAVRSPDNSSDLPKGAQSTMTVRDNLRLLRLKPEILLVCATAACGGLLFGYDLGVTGGVTGMPSFLEKFYPNVIHDQQLADSSAYCKFNDHLLTLWTSSMFLAGAVASLVVLLLTNRKLLPRTSPCWSWAASASASALALPMRPCPPTSLRWRPPPCVEPSTSCSSWPPPSASLWPPSSTRAWRAWTSKVLTRFRPDGHDIQNEPPPLEAGLGCAAHPLLPAVHRHERHHVLSPQLYQVLGFGVKASLFNSVINNCVNLVATFGAIVAVDALGRKFLFLGAGSLMFVMQIATGSIAAVYFKNGYVPPQVGAGMLTTICLFVAGFACSWGPLGWLVPSEIHTNQTRTATMCGTVFVNFIASFIIGQCFNQMLCSMQYAVFFFFAGWLAIMTVWVAICLPETKGIAVETVMDAWATVPNWPCKQKRVSRDLPETNPNITGATNGAASNGDVKV
ncbi:hypothetical protein WJX75_008092 [Coccomyxa subellipsoidea]|uniref:Major facilitator superfamily (MFS) profile domain-containing protein n=1 Tax=Coccomyxa subellipsoidea TaxID=248742 RepID=A0ABR2Z1C1_9CHLO